MRLPAYGKELLAARRAGKRPDFLVFVTDWWQFANLQRNVADAFALVCDPLNAPYDFLCLQGLDVVLAHVHDDALGCAERIARAQPRELMVFSGYDEVMRIVASLETVISRRSSAGARIEAAA